MCFEGNSKGRTCQLMARYEQHPCVSINLAEQWDCRGNADTSSRRPQLFSIYLAKAATTDDSRNFDRVEPEPQGVAAALDLQCVQRCRLLRRRRFRFAGVAMLGMVLRYLWCL